MSTPLVNCDPFAAHPHPHGLGAVPAVQAVHDAELADATEQAAAAPIAVPDDGELADMRKADLVDLADRLGLDTAGSKAVLADRLREHRDSPPVSDDAPEVDDLDGMDDAELAGLADDLALSTDGTRDDLISRIRAARAEGDDTDAALGD